MKIVKVLNAIRRQPKDSEDDRPRVYVSRNGSLYVKGDELIRSAWWRKKVMDLIDADLMGRTKQREGNE